MTNFWHHAGRVGASNVDASDVSTTGVPIGAIYIRTDTDAVSIWDGANWIRLDT